MKTDATGKYHWYYEMGMFTNPTVFITCWKAFAVAVGIVALIMFFIMIGVDGISLAALFFLKFLGIGLGLMTVLLVIGYSIYSLVMGVKYCVIFEMDGRSVKHIQLAKQFEKAQVISALTFLMGAERGSLTMMGTGLLAGSRNTMETEFASVNKIKVNQRRNVIYLKSGFSNNQIYVQDEDFKAVLDFILERVPANAKRMGI